MSKVDDMRKQREARFAERERAAKSRPIPPEPPSGVGSLDNEPPPQKKRPVATPFSGSSQGAGIPVTLTTKPLAVGEARCPGCNKIRAIRNGKIANHQKGLGTQCPGAGKAP